MTLYPQPTGADFDPNAETQSVDISPPAPVAAPSFTDLVGASFRTENTVGSALNDQRVRTGPVDPAFNPYDAIKGTKYEPFYDRFARETFNPGQSDAMKSQIDQEETDARTKQAAGGWATITDLGAGLFSPENLVPIGGETAMTIKGGRSVLSHALTGVATGAISAAIGEDIKQGSQVTRPLQESFANVAASALISGLLGTGAGVILGRRELSQLTDRAASQTQDVFGSTAQAENEQALAQSIGAAARETPTLDENTIAGRSAQVIGMIDMNPNLRILHSPSPAVRDIGTRLLDNPVYLKKNFADVNVASDPAVENLVKEFDRGRYADAIEYQRNAYKDFRKSGGTSTYREFDEAVGKAARTGDTGPDDYTSRAAKYWRSQIGDPLKDKAIESRLLPPDIAPTEAPSYFHRVYNVPKMLQEEGAVKATFQRYIDKSLNDTELNNRMAEAREGQPTGEQQLLGQPSGVPEFLGESDRKAYVQQIADEVFNTITGRNADGDMPTNLVMSRQGPLKERTFHIPDAQIEPWLESGAEDVWHRYTRKMSSDVELTRAFGSPDMQQAIQSIRDDYAKLRATAATLAPEKQEGAIKRLAALEKRDVNDIEASRDMLRGTYMRRENSTNFARVLRAAGTINYMRTLGGVTLSSLTDIARPLMVHRLAAFSDGLVPLIRSFKGFAMSVNEAKQLGAVVESVLSSRLATVADLVDPYSMSSPFERFMHNAASTFSKYTFLDRWTDMGKAISSVITQARILRGSASYVTLPAKERAYLAFLGIDNGMADRIARQFDQFGTDEQGVQIAHSDRWTDAQAQRTYRAAVNRDVDSTIVTKGIGDVPLFFRTPAGRMMSQFKGFSVASHQRVLMRGMQEGAAGMASGVLTSVALGMMIYVAKAYESGTQGQLENINPGRLIAEGLDRSGLFAIPFEANNTIEKGLGVGAYGAMEALFPNSGAKGAASRYSTRSSSWAALLTGPTGDLIAQTEQALRAIISKTKGKDLTAGDINAIRSLVPGATLPGIKSLLNYLVVPGLKRAAGVE